MSQSHPHSSQPSKEEILRRMAEWSDWHSPIDLGQGITTGGKLKQRRFARRLHLLQIPENLEGQRVLDIGSWDGFFTWEMERRGADVLSIDVWDNRQMEKYI